MRLVKRIFINKLKAHEKINGENLAKVKRRIKKNRCIKNPIIVESDNFIILDGHHRVRALSELGYSKVPALLIDYFDSRVRVSARRKNIKICKQLVIGRALTNKPYPYKTTKHYIPDRPKMININLNELI